MIEKPIVVLGGGVAGLTVSKILAGNKIPCVIVERDYRLGGNAGNWACMATDQCLRCSACLSEDLVREIRGLSNVEVLTSWQLSAFSNSDATPMQIALKSTETSEEKRLQASGVVIATGFEPYDPQDKLLLGYGKHESVYTLSDLDSLIKRDVLADFMRGQDKLKAAFFQCVGSRDLSDGANYCSHYCCAGALRMALKLVHEYPGVEATIFYIDLQLAGKYAPELLKQAEDKNIKLRQGVPGEILFPEAGPEVVVEHDGRNVRESFDRIILSVGQRPSKSTQMLAGQLGLSENQFGFVDQAEASDPCRTSIPAVYLAGTCAGPKDIRRTIEHAGRTASEILVDIQKGILR